MLTAKEQRRLKRYESDFAMPKWKYILGYGLTWGILMFIFSTISDFVFDKTSVQWDLSLLRSFFVKVSIGGLLFGWFMRMISLRDYKKLKSKAD